MAQKHSSIDIGPNGRRKLRCHFAHMRQPRKNAVWQRVKSRLFGSGAAFCFFLTLGAVGGMDCNTITTARGVAIAVAGLVGALACTYMAGGFLGQ